MKKESKYEIINRLTTEGKITPNEARILLGYAPLDDEMSDCLMIRESRIEEYSNQLLGVGSCLYQKP